MTSFAEAMSALEARATLKAEAEDYMQDGLLYCGRCNTPKQYRGYYSGTERIVPCICKCRAEAMEAEETQAKQQRLQEQIRKQRREGFFENGMADCTFQNNDGENQRIMDAMGRYVDNFSDFYRQGKGLILYGGTGTGNTYAAACVANALIDRGRPCLMTNFARVLNTLWNAEDKQAYIDSFNQFDLLILDDLGAERKSDYAQEQVFNIIDARYRARLPMIITTNLTLKELLTPENIAHGRIYDRVLEVCHPVEFTGSSRRRKKIANDYKSMNDLLGL